MNAEDIRNVTFDKIVMRAGQNGLLVLGAEKCRAG